MHQMHGGQQDQSADNNTGDNERGRRKFVPLPYLPRNRSTGNLALATNAMTERGRYRMSIDAPLSATTDFDVLARSASQLPDHEHGIGLSGLRRIRQQHPPSRNPTVPNSGASSRSPSVAAIPRSTSSSGIFAAGFITAPQAVGPSSPSFSEDLTRFPSESLHSFSFAHQSDDFLQNRQNVLKRSMDFMKDRMSHAKHSTQAALANAHGRFAGDADAQNLLDILDRAQLTGVGSVNKSDPSAPAGPGENAFDNHLMPESEATDKSEIIPDAADVSPKSTHASVPDASEGAPAANFTADGKSEDTSRTSTDESRTTAQTSPPASRRMSLKRTMTDTVSMTMQDKLVDFMGQPFLAGQPMYEEPMGSQVLTQALPVAHGHTNRWVPAAQAIFTTEAKPPWTIIAANDLACLVFGVTKAEVRKMGILEVVQEERRAWLERKLSCGNEDLEDEDEGGIATSAATTLLSGRAGITAKLLSKPNSRSQPQKYSIRRAQTVHGGTPNLSNARAGGQNKNHRSRGVLLCGDVVPIQKRNGATGSASLWVKEKRVGLIWVLEEIHEDVAYVDLDEDGVVEKVSGAAEPIWGFKSTRIGLDVATLIPRIPRQGIDPTIGEIDFAQINRRRYFTCPNSHQVNIPCAVEQVRGKLQLRVSTFPHMAGIVVVDPESLKILSSNSVFCGALFGYEKPDGMLINALVPEFDKILQIMTEEDGLQMLDGMVVPEHRFRRASVFLALRDRHPDAAVAFLHPDGLSAKHRDGSTLKIDVQLRVVESEKRPNTDETVIESGGEANAGEADDGFAVPRKEMVLALWITYSRQLHVHTQRNTDSSVGTATPLHQPSPGQTPPAHTPMEVGSDEDEPKKEKLSPPRVLPTSVNEVAMSAASKLDENPMPSPRIGETSPITRDAELTPKPTIDNYAILEDMGQGAYGQVKLARHKQTGKRVVLKYVTKRRILVDTWTRDRKLGTVPLEIHVLDYLRKPEFRHPNIVEMEGFFEDDVNYYIEMSPHGLPGMDLFDYIELRANMEEAECRSIFVQVAQAIQFLHNKAHVVHRDIKDENVILDGEGNIKLIDFGSAAYVKSGPFDVFVGTIDYAAPEVLAGKPYGGKEQDVWALGILLYTIIYKENPFYSIDEIMDRDLRVPFIISDESIDLVRCMLNRDVKERYDINQVLEHPWCKAIIDSK
ncbi:serine/threonine protein kinase [Drechmeria coniospora]|uniref:non-specific serine/threonine protein kinase n=1 Tax=Drechmeria coniospora TaxID=98403 RepID=A0A151GL15_DRECN|nr:serine/threonine protein kinase [Drechmeria coniospora]KYK57797.1 serine/threonine protein kinase [Drechmeria coniospora]